MNEYSKKILNRLALQCSRREYCMYDIDEKLKKYEKLTDDERKEIKEYLQREKYVSDSRYSNYYVRDKTRLNGWGETKIRFMLRAKRIDNEIINEALQRIDAEEVTDKLKELLERKNKSIKDVQSPVGIESRRQKLLRYGVSRGYSYEQVMKAINAIL